MIKIDLLKEIKILTILIFCLGSVFLVKEEYLLPILAIDSLFLLILAFYIKSGESLIGRNVFLLIIAIVNVFTLIFMIQYLVRGEINSLVYDKTFFFIGKSPYQMVYIGWIFLLTLGLLLTQILGGGDSGR